MRGWHQALESQAPGAHLAWLLKQGFNEKQALRLKWLSKDMNEHDHYMADFERIFDGLDRLGPGSAEDTLAALSALPAVPKTLLDIGCGRGVSTLLLAQHTQGLVTAVDNDEYSLASLKAAVTSNAVEHQVRLLCASMTDLPFEGNSFDAVWAEGSAYIMGFGNALKCWRRFIKPQGFLVVSDLIWLGNTPEADGDGQKYRGCGLIQITGYDNYLACSKALFGDDRLLRTPELLEQAEWAAKSTAWFWSSRNLNALADSGSFEMITRRINGGPNGYAERMTFYNIALKVLA